MQDFVCRPTRLEKLVYGQFLEPEPRKAFFEAYKEIEALWEILSPSPELRSRATLMRQRDRQRAELRKRVIYGLSASRLSLASCEYSG